MKMMYRVIAREIQDVGIRDKRPQDYLNFYCLGNREEEVDSGGGGDDGQSDNASPAEKPSRCVNRIKAGFVDEHCPCTVLEAVMAVLWQCRTRVAMPAASEAPVPLLFPVNVRKQVGAKPGYYGNCITSGLAGRTGTSTTW
jgi:hypothetical protein